MKSLLIAATTVLALAACSKRDAPPPPPKTSALPAAAVPVTQATPPLPEPNAPKGAPGAIDSPATDPVKPLTKEEESNSMPMAGHGNNHSSPSLPGPKSKSPGSS